MSNTYINPNAIKDNSIGMSKLAEDVIEAISAGAAAGLEERIAALETALANAALVAKVTASEYQEMVNNGTANDEYLYVITEDDSAEA
jgi:hypothetical protein